MTTWDADARLAARREADIARREAALERKNMKLRSQHKWKPPRNYKRTGIEQGQVIPRSKVCHTCYNLPDRGVCDACGCEYHEYRPERSTGHGQTFANIGTMVDW